MKEENEIDIVSLFWIAWKQKYLVIAIAILGGAIAAFLALTAIPLFRAQVNITEVRDTGIGGSGSMGQLGGLASIAGLNLNGNGPEAERLAVLESRGLIDAFIRRYQLAPLINGPTKFQNSVWFAVERFRKSVLEMHEDKLKDTTTITMTWRDPQVAARWANDFVGLANELLRDRAIRESTSNIDFLNKQLAQTSVVEIQHAISNLIETETKSLMLAHGRLEYAFTVVDPAVVPEVRFSPRRALMVMSGLLIGGVIGILVAVVRNAIRRRPSIATS